MENKICNKCNRELELTEFHKNVSACKSCTALRKKLQGQTKEGLISKIYQTQKKSSVKRGHAKPSYSLEELSDWCMSQDIFHVLYNNWKRLDFQKWYRPSVDRKNDYIGYTMSNIQLMTWKENSDKSALDRKNGISKNDCKAVVRYSYNGDYIEEFHSAAEAGRVLNITPSTILKVCRGVGKAKIAKDSQWRFKSEGLESISPIKSEKRAVDQYSKEGVFMQSFNSIKEAGDILDINPSSISGGCNSRYNLVGGFKFKYSNGGV